MRDRITNKPRGFGFITFKDEAASTRACQEVHTLDGRTIDAKPSVPQGEGQRPRSKKIFVGGLAPDTTEEQFQTYFSQYGTVIEAQIMVDHTSGRSRGFGFVTFEEESSVDSVFAAGSMHELNGKKVEVKNATPKGSGPQGSRAGGRGVYPSRGFLGGRGYGELSPLHPPYGMPPTYPPGGYMVGAYGYGLPPFSPYSGMMMGHMGGYGAYGYGGYGAAFPPQTSPIPSPSTSYSPSPREYTFWPGSYPTSQPSSSRGPGESGSGPSGSYRGQASRPGSSQRQLFPAGGPTGVPPGGQSRD